MSSSGRASSSSSSPSSGTPGRDEPFLCRLPRPDLKFLAKALAAFVLSLALWYLIRFPYSRTITGAGAWILSLFGGPPPDEMIRIKDSRFYLFPGLLGADGKPMRKELNLNVLHWNLFLFGSLVLLTPARAFKERWKGLLSGAVLLWCSHVFFFVLMTITALAIVYESQDVPFLSPNLLLVISSVSLIYGSILAPVIPLFLAAPVLLARPKARLPSQVKGAPRLGRNDPCPCGSGKKFKRCCGR